MTAADAIAFIRAHEASLRASDARAALPLGSSRAQLTTANAAWARAAEHRDRLGAELPQDFVTAVQVRLVVTPRGGR